MRARSTSSSASRSSASAGSCSWISTLHAGVGAASSATTGSSERRIAVAKPATRTEPTGSASGSRSSRAASTAARIVTAWSASRRPAGVSRTRRPTGSISGVPASRASAAICCETVDVVTPARRPPRASSRAGTARRAAGGGGRPCRHRSRFTNGMSSKSRGHERSCSGRLAHDRPRHQHVRRSAPASAPRWRSPRCCASSSASPSSVGLIDHIGTEGAAWLRLAWAGVSCWRSSGPGAPTSRVARCAACVAARGRDGRRHPAVHGRRRAAAAGHRQRAGVPRPARRRRRPRARASKTWPALAAVGVLLLTQPWHGEVDLLGVGFALAAAVCWAAYILLTQHVGDEVAGIKALAVSMPVAALDRHRGRRAEHVRPADARAPARRPRARRPAAGGAVHAGAARAAPAHHRGVRHADEPRARVRPARRAGRPAPGARRTRGGRHRLRGRRRHRRERTGART